mgnify:CR=1 FL=1
MTTLLRASLPSNNVKRNKGPSTVDPGHPLLYSDGSNHAIPSKTKTAIPSEKEGRNKKREVMQRTTSRLVGSKDPPHPIPSHPTHLRSSTASIEWH